MILVAGSNIPWIPPAPIVPPVSDEYEKYMAGSNGVQWTYLVSRWDSPLSDVINHEEVVLD